MSVVSPARGVVHELGVGQCGTQVGGGGVVPGIAPSRYPAGTSLRLVLPGPNQWYIPGYEVPAGTPGPCRPFRTPAPRQYQHASDRRDSASNILKLVNMPECRLKSAMRPAMLPVLKRGP